MATSCEIRGYEPIPEQIFFPDFFLASRNSAAVPYSATSTTGPHIYPAAHRISGF
jgi:hypothetical protein